MALGTLTPQISLKYALNWQQFAVVLAYSAWFLYLSYIPLPHSVTWHHLSVGSWIVQNQAIPTVDPTLPLAAGMDWMTTSWLADVILFFANRVGGPVGLSAVLTMTVWLTSVLLGNTFYRAWNSKRWMLAGLLAVLAFGWVRVGLLRPVLFGWLCFAALLLILQVIGAEAGAGRSSSRLARWAGPLLPALLAVWANLDGSVLLGAAVVLAWACGSVIDAARRSGGIRIALDMPVFASGFWWRSWR